MKDYSIYTGVSRTFGVVDYVMFGLLLFISAAIGLFFQIKDRKKSAAHFQLGGKTMGIFPVAMSLLVTFLSALSILGNPVEVYNYNTMFWYLCLALVFAMLTSGWVFVPYFYNLGLTSIFEYLELRFNKGVRNLASVMYIFTTLVYMSFVLYAPSLALTAVTQINLWGIVIGLQVVVTAYTALGGMKAVVWTDTFQSMVIVAGLLAVLIQGSNEVGGFGEAWAIAEERGRIVFDEFDPDPKVRHSFWTIVFGGGIFWMTLYSLNQAQVQRCMSVPSVNKARIALMLNMVGLILILSVTFMIGVVMFAIYADCHPTKFMNLISKSDQMLPLLVMDILGQVPGVPGIFVSCVFSGSLSTLSSSLNALSAVTIEDFVKPYCCGKKLTDLRATIISKLLVVVYGAAGIGLAFVVSQLGAILQASYSITAIVNGPISGLFILGLFFPWANKWGAIVGCITSLIIMSWIGFGAFANRIFTLPSSTSIEGCNWNLTTTTMTTTIMTTTDMMAATTIPPTAPESSDPFYDMYKLSYLWYTATGMLIEVVVGLVVSFITGATKPKDLDPRLILLIFDQVLPCLPESIRSKLRCGVNYNKKIDSKPNEVNISVIPTDSDKKQINGEVIETKDIEFTRL